MSLLRAKWELMFAEWLKKPQKKLKMPIQAKEFNWMENISFFSIRQLSKRTITWAWRIRWKLLIEQTYGKAAFDSCQAQN